MQPGISTQGYFLSFLDLAGFLGQNLGKSEVSKNQVNNQTISHIELLNEKDRVNEVARMLGGIEITTKTLDHAKEILS